jgi:HAD superfamily hydrolase (TIGR01459 family)
MTIQVHLHMTNESAAIPVLTGIAEISEGRKAWFCDVWGVLHDGVTVFVPAIEACRAFKRRGGEVILVSNSPKPSPDVLARLDELGVPRDCFTALVTSGDVTRSFVEAYASEPLFHLGPEDDKGIFDGLAVEFAPASKAAAVVCTGFFDEDRERPEAYDDMLRAFAERRAPMICANPDRFVERGPELLPCAGLLAERYASLGQTVIQAGKPHRPIYEAAARKLSKPLASNAILAIGDGIATDIEGAAAQGIDSVYIASRVHMAEGGLSRLGEANSLFAGRPFRPAAAMPCLRW